MAVGQGGLAPRRAGQDYDPPNAVLAPGGNAGVFRGRLIIIKGSAAPSSGLFVYDNSGNLIDSITFSGGPGPLGGTSVPGIASYNPAPKQIAQLNAGQLLLSYASTAAPASLGVQGGGNDSVATLTSGTGQGVGDLPAELLLTSSAGNAGVPVADFPCQVIVSNGQAGGQILVVENTTANPSSSNFQLISASPDDNAWGIMISGNAFNSLKATEKGFFAGPGNATQDIRFVRDASGVWVSDNILASIGGAAENWRTMGTLAGATVNKGQFRKLPDGEIKFEASVTFGGMTAAPISFSAAVPVALRPPGNVDVRIPTAFTNAAGAIARLFIGSAGGGSPGLIQFAAFANVIGTYDFYGSYSILT